MSPDHDRTCETSEQAAALALHVLEPDEETAVRTHLPHCRSCRRTVRTTERVMGQMGAAVHQTEPPDRLRSTILARAAATPQEHATATLLPVPQPTDRTRRRAPSRPAGRNAGDDQRPGSTGRSSRPSGSRRGRLIAACVALVALLGIGAGGIYTAQVQHQRDALLAQSRTLADLVTGSTQPRALLRTPEGSSVAAVLTGPSGPAVVTSGMAANQIASSTYVLWGIDATGAHPLGTFDVTADAVTHTVPASGTGFSAYAISLEPGRSLPRSPTTVVASGPVQA